MDAKVAKITEFINGLMSCSKTAGLAVGAVHHGRVVYSKGFGLASADTQRPMTPHTQGTPSFLSIALSFISIGGCIDWLFMSSSGSIINKMVLIHGCSHVSRSSCDIII
jgi:hypothetical protein